ncbi:MAG: hypothetical protein WB493_02490 [Anaeromyxobacteraceae bacterium]
MNWTRVAVASILAVGIAASAFLALRPDEGPPPSAAPDSRMRPEAPPGPGSARPAPPVAGTTSPSPPGPARRPDGAATTPQQQAALAVDRVRDQLLAGCRRELGETRTPLSFRVRLVFDAQGREVIRSVTADQKSPQPIANCLARVAAGTLRIPPTGRTVTTVVPLSIP